MNQLVLSAKFQKDLKKILSKQPNLKFAIKKTLKQVRKNITHPSLRLHKLQGQSFWSISVNMKLRIILHQEKGKLYLLRVGPHDQVY